MILIMILSLILVNDIKERLKHKFTQAKYIKTQLEKYLNIRLSLNTIQNILHIPFFLFSEFMRSFTPLKDISLSDINVVFN